MPRKLVHYLRSERRIAGYTQADIAALLGAQWKTRVARYETGVLPPIELALAYEVIFGKPVSELLAGRHEEIAAEVRRRARELLLRDTHRTPRYAQRKRSLERIAA